MLDCRMLAAFLMLGNAGWTSFKRRCKGWVPGPSALPHVSQCQSVFRGLDSSLLTCEYDMFAASYPLVLMPAVSS
jgi:hypothetical protein